MRRKVIVGIVAGSLGLFQSFSSFGDTSPFSCVVSGYSMDLSSRPYKTDPNFIPVQLVPIAWANNDSGEVFLRIDSIMGGRYQMDAHLIPEKKKLRLRVLRIGPAVEVTTELANALFPFDVTPSVYSDPATLQYAVELNKGTQTVVLKMSCAAN